MADYKFTGVGTAADASAGQDPDGIVRVYADPDIKPTIELDELSIPDMENPGETRSVQHTEGFELPVIRVNDYIVEQSDISWFSIDVTGFLPRITLVIRPNANTFLIKNTPKDGDMISVALRPKNDVYKTLRCDFVIKSMTTSGAGVTGTGRQTISMSGDMFIPGLDTDKSCFGFIGTSKDAMKDAAGRLGAGFAFNDEDESNDTQLWLCYTQSVRDYIKNVMRHSWKDETSFYDAWFDPYYNLTYIEVNKCINSPDTSMDVAAITSAMRTAWLNPNPETTEQKNAEICYKGLINNEAFKNTVFYITDWSVENKSTSVTFDIGTEIVSGTFRHNQNIYNNEDDPLENLSNVPAYNQTKIDSHIILRGRAADSSASDSSVKRQSRANYSYKDIYVRKPWSGIEYVMSDDDSEDTVSTNTWSGNTHANYNRAEYHNLINSKELDKLYIKVKVNGLNTQIIRGEKIPVILYMPSNTMAQVVNGDKIAAGFNIFYSGWYYVAGVTYRYEHPKSDDDKMVGYKTEFILKRREWPAPYTDETEKKSK